MADAVRDRARRLAEEVFFPAALQVDATGEVPASHLDLLAEHGFYGLAAPRQAGGVGEDPRFAGQVLEILAGACLTTTFVWMQHHSAVIAAAASTRDGIRETWLEPLARGRRRAGLALAALRPGPASVRVRKVPGGYRLDGEAPWVTGWGHIDTMYTAARDADDTVIWLLVDAVAGPTLRVHPLEMVAVSASRTVEVHFAGHLVAADRVTGTLPYREWPGRDAAGLRLNGSLALGLTARCCRLIGPSPLDGDLVACRAALDAATPETMPAARADASALAMRAASALAVYHGSRSVLLTDHAQRLLREAAFLLVFGSRPRIRASLLRYLRDGPG
jgi:alkylation response protein AidB-like acyl-CoA dehydrogenase